MKVLNSLHCTTQCLGDWLICALQVNLGASHASWCEKIRPSKKQKDNSQTDRGLGVHKIKWHTHKLRQIHAISARKLTCVSFFHAPKIFNKPFEFLLYKSTLQRLCKIQKLAAIEQYYISNVQLTFPVANFQISSKNINNSWGNTKEIYHVGDFICDKILLKISPWFLRLT